MPELMPLNQANQRFSTGKSRMQEDFLETWVDAFIRRALWPLRVQAPPSPSGRKEIQALAASSESSSRRSSFR